jgi:hypothetical protein
MLAHWCQAMPISMLKLAESLALIIKPEPKLMALAVIKPYQLPPDY